MHPIPLRIAGALLALGWLSLPQAAHAGDHRYSLDATYRAECGSCHVAYPPRLLDAAGWQRTLATLDRHFDTDAGIDAATRTHLAAWLRVAAGRAAAAAGEPRITTTEKFRREHRKIPSAVVAGPPVRTMANCAACHPGAADGDYDEDAVRVPGLARGGSHAASR